MRKWFRLLFCGWRDASGERPSRLVIVFGMLVLCFGLVLRFYGAWAFRYITDPDCGIVALMAKHMAAGDEFPVFFYGQDYMGSLEPAVSALLCRLFGVSGLTVCLGTTLLSMLVLPIVYLWGRDAGGRSVGLGALLFIVIGPYYFLMFQFAPRGGYMATVLLGTAVMWLSSRAATGAAAGCMPTRGRLFLIGFLAGLGWWTNPLILSALLASSAVLMLGFRRRPWGPCVLAGVAGFLLGSLPFWLWNATQDWPTLKIMANVGSLSPRVGMSFLWQRFDRLWSLPDWTPWIQQGALVCVLCLLVVGFVWGLVTMRRQRAPLNMPLVCATAFILLSMLFFVRSGFATMNTARYLTPLVPAAGLLFGLTVGGLLRVGGLVPAAIPIALVLACQLHGVAKLKDLAHDVAAKEAFESHFVAFLKAEKIEAVYGHFMSHSFNFNTDEAVRFTTLAGERYAPIAREAELAERIGLLENTGRVTDFLKAAGGQSETEKTHGLRVDFNLEPPTGGLAPLPTTTWARVTTDVGEDVTARVSDQDVDTWWQSRGQDGPEYLQIMLQEPTPLRRLRIVAPDAAAYPRDMRIDVQLERDGEWVTRRKDVPVTPYYWSGSRVYNSGPGYRLEVGLRNEPIVGIRFIVPGDWRPGHIWSVSEIQLFQAAADAGSESKHLEDLLALIEAAGLRRVYSDRWEANRIYQHFAGGVEVVLFDRAFPDAGIDPQARLKLDSTTALVTSRHDAPATVQVLLEQGIIVNETTVGPWTVLLPALDGERKLPVAWVGFGCLKGHTRLQALELLAQAEAQYAAAANPSNALALVEQAMTVDPDAVTGAGKLLQQLQDALPGGLPRTIIDDFHHRTQPGTLIQARFVSGVELLGVTFDPPVVAPGQALDVTYFWRCPPAAPIHNWLVFVHLDGDRTRIQDDHALLATIREQTLSQQPLREVFREQRRLSCPPMPAPGRIS